MTRGAPGDALRDLYRRPGFLLKRCHQVAAAIFMEECGEFSVTPSQYGALRVLQSFPGIDQAALGRLTGLDRTTTGLVVRLCFVRALIERAPNAGDRRRVRLQLTAAGMRLLAGIAPAARRVEARVLAGVPRAARNRFLGLLEQFLAGHGATIDVAEASEASLRAARRRPATSRDPRAATTARRGARRPT